MAQIRNKVIQLANQMQAVIVAKNLHYSDKLPSELQWMKRCGTSRSTVRRAMNLLEERNIIFRQHGKGTFVGERTNIDLAEIDGFNPVISKEIAIVLPAVSDTYFAGIYEAANDVLHSRGHRTYLITATQGLDYVQHLNDKRIDGAILCIPYRLFAEYINDDTLPQMVFVNDSSKDLWYHICNDDENGAYMVTEYLISLGHTDIVHLAGAPEASTSNERISGYKRAMIAHQLTRYTHIIEANFLQKDAYEKVKLLLAERTPHAIFCANDSSAAGAYRAIQEHSLLIPDDISIIGYGNQAIGMQLNPPLTSVNQGPQIIGQIAAMILLTQMNSGHHESGCIRIPAALIFRGSCRSRHQS